MKVVALPIKDEEGKVTYQITDLQKHCVSEKGRQLMLIESLVSCITKQTGTLELRFRVSVVTGVPGEEKQANIEIEHKLNKFIAHN